MNTISCPICASTSKPDPQAHAQLSLHAAPKKYTITRCTGCGFRWMTPYPVPSDYQMIYGHNYYESEQEGGFSYRSDKQELIPCYAEIIDRFRTFAIRERLLDIGCGTGDFLTAAHQGGISGEGVEPSEYAANIAKEKMLSVTQGLLSDIVKSQKVFAAAHCSHVLEHVPDAHTFMAELNSVLEPGAPLYIEVPLQIDGILDWMNRLRQQHRKYSDFSIHHHYFFTPDALLRLLNTHGFEVISLTTFLPCRRTRRRTTMRKLALQSLLWAADRLGQRGDVISVWARRGK